MLGEGVEGGPKESICVVVVGEDTPKQSGKYQDGSPTSHKPRPARKKFVGTRRRSRKQPSQGLGAEGRKCQDEREAPKRARWKRKALVRTPLSPRTRTGRGLPIPNQVSSRLCTTHEEEEPETLRHLRHQQVPHLLAARYCGKKCQKADLGEKHKVVRGDGRGDGGEKGGRVPPKPPLKGGKSTRNATVD